MHLRTIKKKLNKGGPLEVRTSDSERYPVPHPEFVWVGRRSVVIEDPDGAVDIIDALHVVAISRPASAKATNGK